MGTLSERHVVGEHLRLRRSPLWPDRRAPAGDGRPLVLVSGFGMPAATLNPLRRWLAAGGWHVQVAPTGWNVDCGEATVDRIREAIDTTHREHGPVALVGHSRGGLLARVVAARLDRQVSDLVTICTPWALGPPDRAGVASMSHAIRFVRRHGVDTLASIDCADGPCCASFRTDMTLKPQARWTAIWSSRDSIGGQDSRPPAAADRAVDVATTHLGAVCSISGWHAIGSALTRQG